MKKLSVRSFKDELARVKRGCYQLASFSVRNSEANGDRSASAFRRGADRNFRRSGIEPRAVKPSNLMESVHHGSIGSDSA